MKNIDKLANEIQTAREKYGPFNSTHEVYGVLIEEVEEFFDLVRTKTLNTKSGDPFENHAVEMGKIPDMTSELLQIAAIALRAIDELEHDQIKWV
jgi:hypothetical protein